MLVKWLQSSWNSEKMTVGILLEVAFREKALEVSKHPTHTNRGMNTHHPWKIVQLFQT